MQQQYSYHDWCTGLDARQARDSKFDGLGLVDSAVSAANCSIVHSWQLLILKNISIHEWRAWCCVFCSLLQSYVTAPYTSCNCGIAMLKWIYWCLLVGSLSPYSTDCHSTGTVSVCTAGLLARLGSTSQFWSRQHQAHYIEWHRQLQ